MEPIGGWVCESDAAFRGVCENRIGKRGERNFRHLAGLEDLIARRLPVRTELGGHFVERIGELAELILRVHRDDLVEFSIAKFPRNGRERLDRLENRLLQPHGEEDRRGHAKGACDNHITCGAGAELARVAVRLHHGILVDGNDLLRGVLDPCECWQHLAEIHGAPFSKIGGLPEYAGARRIFFVRTAQVVSELVLARKRNIAQFGLQPFFEDREVPDVKIAATFLFAHEGEKQTGVHSLGSLFHLLTGKHAAKIFPQDDIHSRSQFAEK